MAGMRNARWRSRNEVERDLLVVRCPPTATTSTLKPLGSEISRVDGPSMDILCNILLTPGPSTESTYQVSIYHTTTAQSCAARTRTLYLFTLAWRQ